jgi:hypothetical protein
VVPRDRADRTPRLTDYLSIRWAEEAGTTTTLAPRAFDEKFHILEAPALGHAYRFGGDEYVLLFPNADEDTAIRLCHELQDRLGNKAFNGVDVRIGVSIGICVVDAECMLTDREILGRANLAKNHAKTQKKGSVASYVSPSFRPGDLVLR